jgi:hypothetical protein
MKATIGVLFAYLCGHGNLALEVSVQLRLIQAASGERFDFEFCAIDLNSCEDGRQSKDGQQSKAHNV